VRKIWLGIVAAVLVATGCTATPGNVGDCGAMKDMSRGRSDMSEVGCSSPEAMYTLVDTVSGRSPSCPRGDYVEDTSARNRKTERRTRKCYALHVKEGECLKPVGSSYERTQCGGTSKRVSKVVQGQFDAKLCAAGDDTRVYSRPALTICIS
jgi:hypothetical protein